MKKFWAWLLGVFVGFGAGILAAFLLVRDNINKTMVTIKKPKIKDSEASQQDFTTQITDMAYDEDKKAMRLGKKAARKTKRLIKKQSKN